MLMTIFEQQPGDNVQIVLIMTGYIREGVKEVKTRLIMIITDDKKGEDTRNKILKKVLFEDKSVLKKEQSVVVHAK